MAEITSITNEAEYELAEARLVSMTNKPAKDDAEEQELRALLKAVNDYVDKEYADLHADTDGVDHIGGMLDAGGANLDEMIEVFGSLERFVDFMTRKENIDSEMIDALVSRFHLKREYLAKPFLRQGGWDYIMMDTGEPCDDPICCNPDDRDWRAELLAGINRDGQDAEDDGGLFAEHPAYPAYRC